MENTNENQKIIDEIGPKFPANETLRSELLNHKLNTSKQKVEKKPPTLLEKTLLPTALVLGIAFDQIVINRSPDYFVANWSIFLIIFTIVFFALNRKKLRNNYLLWGINALNLGLMGLNISFSFSQTNFEYSELSFFIIPNVLMVATQFSVGEISYRNLSKSFSAFAEGWFLKPFTGIKIAFQTLTSLADTGKNKAGKKILLAILILIPIISVLIALLTSADAIFNYYLQDFIALFHFEDFIVRIISCSVAALLFYSFIWNTLKLGDENDKNESIAKGEHRAVPIKFDILISTIVLGAVLTLYTIFSTVQFTFLFAREGLPEGYTYSEYAVQGFWQLILVAGINLLLFGLFYEFVEPRKWFRVMLIALLGATAIMLVSAATRLWLYMSVYGLTWLRLISMWFIAFLCIVLLLTLSKIKFPQMPLIVICALLLLFAFVILGAFNPDNLIDWFNITHHLEVQEFFDRI